MQITFQLLMMSQQGIVMSVGFGPGPFHTWQKWKDKQVVAIHVSKEVS